MILVDSNDALYGADPKFIAEINKMCGIIIDEILAHLKQLGQNNQERKQASLLTELFIRVMLRGDITQPFMANLAINLWQLGQRNNCVDKKSMVNYKKNIFKKKKQDFFLEPNFAIF